MIEDESVQRIPSANQSVKNGKKIKLKYNEKTLGHGGHSIAVLPTQ